MCKVYTVNEWSKAGNLVFHPHSPRIFLFVDYTTSHQVELKRIIKPCITNCRVNTRNEKLSSINFTGSEKRDETVLIEQ